MEERRREQRLKRERANLKQKPFRVGGAAGEDQKRVTAAPPLLFRERDLKCYVPRSKMGMTGLATHWPEKRDGFRAEQAAKAAAKGGAAGPSAAGSDPKRARGSGTAASTTRPTPWSWKSDSGGGVV